MAKKRKKGKKPRRPKVNTQIPISQVRKVSLVDTFEALQNARQYPILGCWTIEDWQESGIAPVIIARKQDDEKVLILPACTPTRYWTHQTCTRVKATLSLGRMASRSVFPVLTKANTKAGALYKPWNTPPAREISTT